MTPILSGLMSMLIRTAPYEDTTTVKEEIYNGMMKELRAAIDVYQPVTLNYDPFFSTDKRCRNERVIHNATLDPGLHQDIHDRLILAKRKISGRTIFPRITKKKIGMEGRSNERIAHGFEDAEYEMGTTESVQRFYHETGIRIKGMTEIGQAFNYNNIGPRSFYRKGPDQDHLSQHIRPIVIHLIDSFPNVHTFLRHNPSGIANPNREAFICMIYDYAAFTSTMDEIYRFTHELAEFFRGTKVTIIDNFFGPIVKDLGEMLHEYNEGCNRNIKFDASDAFHMADFVLNHTAGMLGIPGNIALSTLLHGLHLSVIIGSLIQNKVVGDDAICTFVKGQFTKITLREALENIGKISIIKMEEWDDGDVDDTEDITWNYVKRPITRVGNHMWFGVMVDWPMLHNAIYLQDGIHTLLPSTSYTRLKKYANQYRRFVESVRPMDPSEYEISIIEAYSRSLHGWVGVRRVNAEMHEFNIGQIPCLSWRWEVASIEKWMDEHSACIVSIPVKFVPGTIRNRSSWLIEGGQFRCGSLAVLSWLRKFGYLEAKQMTKRVIVGESQEALDYFHGRLGQFCYEYTVIKRIPAWAKCMISSSPTFVHEDPISDVYEVLDSSHEDMDSDSDVDMLF